MNSAWSQIEKQQLLEALRRYGVNDIAKISNALPYKSVCDIRTIISKFECLAIRSLTEGISSSSSPTNSDPPVDMWIEIMKQILTRNNHNIISRVLKYIALFEKRIESNINLENCYMALSDLTNGQSCKQLDDRTAAFFTKCLSQLAVSVKENNNDAAETYLDHLEFHKLSATKTYRSKIDKNVLTSDVNLNPCKVPASLLTET